MPNVPRHSRSRGSHRYQTRSTHDYDASFSSMSGMSEAGEQESIDATVPGRAITLPKSMYDPSLVAPVLWTTEVNPTLPDPLYPAGTVLYNRVTDILYQNVADVWTSEIDTSLVTAQITAGQIAAGQIGTSHLQAGAITLYDENGQSMITPAGFYGGLRDFIALGLYNGKMVSNHPGTVGNGRTTALPYWTVSRTGSPVITSDTTDGVVIQWSALSDVAVFTSDAIPARSNLPHVLTISSDLVVVAGTVNVSRVVKWYAEDGAYISDSPSQVAAAGVSSSMGFESDPLTPPAGAGYAVVVLSAYQTGSHSGSNKIRFESVSMRLGSYGNYTGIDLSPQGVYASGHISSGDSFFIDSSLGEITEYGGNAFDTYTPTVGGDGTPTYTVRTGRYMKIGKMVFISIHIHWNTAGSGAGAVTIATPSNPDRNQRQVIMGNIDGAATNGSVTLVSLTSGSGATWDAIRKSTGGGFTGADMSAGAQLQLQGWYMEA